MSPEEKWVAFDDDEDAEQLSLSDFPAIAAGEEKGEPGEGKTDRDPAAGEDFEFRTCVGGLIAAAAAADMCAADEVFFGGRILPFRPSVGSDCCPSRSGSRSESMDRCSSATGFISSRSSSLSSRSSCEAPRLSLSNNFYAHPSPSPQLRRARRSSAGRKSTGSSPAGWELFRLGVVKAPEIELHNLRPKRINLEAIESKPSSNSSEKSRVMRFLGRGFGCKCSPDTVEGTQTAMIEKRVERSESSKRGESGRHVGRMMKWLEELSVGKESIG